MRIYNGFWVYILKCKDATFYVGMTNDIDRRVEEHQQGINPESYTFRRRPVKLVWAEKYKYVRDAYRIEKQLKNWSHKKKKALVEERFIDLHDYAECKNWSSHKYFNETETKTDEN